MDEGLVLKGVTVQAGEETLLEDLSVTLRTPSYCVLFGPNGAGKTTLLEVLIGKRSLQKGEIFYNKEPLQRQLQHIAYVPQKLGDFRSFPFSVTECVSMGAFGNTQGKRTASEVKDAVDSALKTVGLEHKRGALLPTLSGGELQRTFLARALVKKPSILLLDEATSAIDTLSRARVRELLSQLKSSVLILNVTHDVGILQEGVDEVLCLNKRLIFAGPPERALSKKTLTELYGHGELSVFLHAHHSHEDHE